MILRLWDEIVVPHVVPQRFFAKDPFVADFWAGSFSSRMSRVTVCLVTPIESAASSTERRLSCFSETIYIHVLSIWKIFQTILSQSGFSAVVEATAG